mmetsp:Transcript_3471/g.6900  ORF Transcript_3471/g.6900 Transcript_3471/m.6900 type:complete len:88 (+) Transcript_3471:1066-1329(+)|eukprot:scaffold4990_cov176-Amphora_coffeaeformis.AAC.12
MEARREAGLNEPRLVSLHNNIIIAIAVLNNNKKVFAFGSLSRSFRCLLGSFTSVLPANQIKSHQIDVSLSFTVTCLLPVCAVMVYIV